MVRHKDETYELELQLLVGRLETASNHYQRLGLAPSASVAEIRDAYVRAIRLHPRSWAARRISDELAKRAERAYETLVEAFAVLSDGDRRFAYNATLATRASVARSVAAHRSAVRDIAVFEPAAGPPAGLHSKHVESPRPVERDLLLNRRAADRLALRLNGRVTGFASVGERWTIAARTEDVSAFGAALRIGKRVSVGQVLYLQLPLPDRLRIRSSREPLYDVFVVVRRVDAPSHGEWCVGVEFLGPNPPAGFLANPTNVFQIERRAEGNLRSEPRYEILLTFGVRFVDERGKSCGETVGHSENLSRRGARIRLLSALPGVDVLELTAPDRSFTTEAVIRNRYREADGLDRACVQFLDACFPTRLYGIDE